MNPALKALLDNPGPDIPRLLGSSVLDKPKSHEQYVFYMLDRTSRMFEWEGLPGTIPAYMLELYLQIFGYAAFVEIQSTDPVLTPQKIATPPGVYIFYGGIGGERDIYYRPKLFTLANPRVKPSVQSTILYPGDEVEGVERPCVLMSNDRQYLGLLPLYNRYASQMVENDISIRSAQINARALIGISTSNDREAESARKFFDNLEAGKLGTLGETAFLDGIQVANIATQSSNTIIQLIELQQYLKASWYNELGLNVNFNMKREYMSEEEIAVNTDILLPLVDDMLACREEAAELLNKVFNLNVTVRKSSAWANKEQEDVAALSEASIAGDIPLQETIADRIEGGTDEKAVSPGVQANVQSEGEQVQSTEQSTGSSAESGTDASLPSDGAATENAENVDGESPVVEVNVNVNINPEGSDSDVESEASEKSEEPDTERGDS